MKAVQGSAGGVRAADLVDVDGRLDLLESDGAALEGGMDLVDDGGVILRSEATKDPGLEAARMPRISVPVS